MSNYNIVLSTNESTVVFEYIPQGERSEAYQSEAALEEAFIKMLTEQGYEYIEIHSSDLLIQNLRAQLERLNNFSFTDKEWDSFFKNKLANANEGIVEKTRKIQEDHIQNLICENGSTMNIALIDKKNIHNNRLQVINQYAETGGKHDTRYDVTVLVNGLPLVHVELKRRGVAIKEAFNQINRYQRDSFWAGSGLFEYVQIFVISNGTNTKYYSNTVRDSHIKENDGSVRNRGKSASNSFEFTSFWADEKNRIIPDLVDFTKTFFAKHTVLNILTRYCVFTSENMLLVMRPYQIAATEKILNRIEIARTYKQAGTVKAGGFIWHTTGSGKTLTSFKTAQLASRLSYIDKVLFVVDRKDLDYQTVKEYDRFEKGAANSNTSTAVLQRQLEDENSKIIVTTIQKLAVFIKKNPQHSVYSKHTVIIFDECHRSQFGDMHRAVTRHFKNYYMFGFTGTPIFAVNSASGKNPELRTTAQAFGDKLHTYTIVNAINDKNVLPFRIDFIKTMDKEENIDDEQVFDIDRERAYNAPERIAGVTKYILEHFNQKTYRNDKAYAFNALTNISEVASARNRNLTPETKEKIWLNGFNSIFAVSSIETAKLYYTEFKRQMQAKSSLKLKIALIYSYGVNSDEAEGIIDEENSDNTDALDTPSRDFLEEAIADYNKIFKTNYDTSADKFQNYYKDVSIRMKNREIDMLIVVNMFLTGFDATTLNTLWVDKNLRMHGLIQAFSRTNRILNSIKTFGNIVCFRNLKKRTESAVALFGDEQADGIVILRPFGDYYNGYDLNGEHIPGYIELIAELKQRFPLSEQFIEGEQRQKDFIGLFGAVLRTRNILTSFDDFSDDDILPERDLQDYMSRYQDLHDEWKKREKEEKKKDINDDIVFEMELIKQLEINIDAVLMLVVKYHGGHCQDKEIRAAITRAVESSPRLRSKRDLIESFIDGINEVDDVMDAWHDYAAKESEKDLTALIETERLRPEETRKFIQYAFRDGGIKTTGTEIDRLLPPASRFGGSERVETKEVVIEKLKAYFEKYYGLGI